MRTIEPQRTTIAGTTPSFLTTARLLKPLNGGYDEVANYC
jgi:hypothetical protein